MGKLAIERFRRWVELLPEPERNIPYKYFEGRMWTPLEQLREMEAGTPVGKRLQEEEEKLLEFETELKRKVYR